MSTSLPITAMLPSISNEKLLELYSRIRPIRRDEDGDPCWLKDFPLDKLRGCSYIWEPEDVGEKVAASGIVLKPIGAFKCLHGYGYYGLFKPSVAEVLSQIPYGFVDEAKAFEIVEAPETAEDFCCDAFNSSAFDHHCHVSVVQLYTTEPAEEAQETEKNEG